MSDGSDYDRLFYPFLFAGGSASADDVLAEVRASIDAKCREIVALRRAALAASGGQIAAAGAAMARAFASGATLLAFGNGGSTTDAQDLVADLMLPPHGTAALPAIALTNDMAIITAVGNDVGFENVFARQVIAYGRPGDIAVGITTSGNSANVVAGLEQAKRQGLLTIALAGYDGGKLARSSAVDFCLTAASDYVPRIQEAQATVYHSLLDVMWTSLRRPGA